MKSFIKILFFQPSGVGQLLQRLEAIRLAFCSDKLCIYDGQSCLFPIHMSLCSIVLMMLIAMEKSCSVDYCGDK